MFMATKTKRWTMEEFHRLPSDDRNKYELVDGELFVSPPPSDEHETAGALLTRVLDPYVAREGLGLIYRPRAVFRIGRRVEVEPDLMVRQPAPGIGNDWAAAPKPALVIEILSPSKPQYDMIVKRAVYLDAGIAEYWIVDVKNRTIRVARADQPDLVAHDQLTWSPAGASAPLTFSLASVFG